MSTRCYIGIPDPARPHLVHARFVLGDGHPAAIVPTLARIWAGHARHDTAVLITAVLAHDWAYLDDTITATSRTDGAPPIPGVGVPLASTGGVAGPPEPVTVFPLRHAAHLDVGWIYLIDPATAHVAVHSDDGDRLARYGLDACCHPHRTAEPRNANTRAPVGRSNSSSSLVGVSR
ncbi:hypothetical protein ACVCAH_26595 [Micromonospora sp. LZ34]